MVAGRTHRDHDRIHGEHDRHGVRHIRRQESRAELRVARTGQLIDS